MLEFLKILTEANFIYTSEAYDACAKFYFCLFVTLLGKPLFLNGFGGCSGLPRWFGALFYVPNGNFFALGGEGSERLPGWIVHLAHFGNVKNNDEKNRV